MDRCPNCGSLMNSGPGEDCPECEHMNDETCECAACVEERREREDADTDESDEG